MALGVSEIQGGIQRMQDISIIKQNEDNKVLIDQSQTENAFSQEVQDRSEQVGDTAETRPDTQGFDASEQGAGEYIGDGGRRRKNGGKKSEEEEKRADGTVFVKSAS